MWLHVEGKGVRTPCQDVKWGTWFADLFANTAKVPRMTDNSPDSIAI